MFILQFLMADVPTNHSCTTVQFADDVAFLHTKKLASSIKKQLQVTVQIFSRYVRKWKLKLNPTKSESVFFTRRRKTKAFPRKEITVEGHDIRKDDIPWTNNAKYLGVTFDQKLTFRTHIDNVIEKAGKCVKMIYPLIARKSKLHRDNKLRIYKSVIRPMLLYAPSILSNPARTHKTPASVSKSYTEDVYQ